MASSRRCRSPALTGDPETWLRYTSRRGRPIWLAWCPVPPRGLHPCNIRSPEDPVPMMGSRLCSWPGVTWADGRSYGPPVSCHQRGPRSGRRERAHTRLGQRPGRPSDPSSACTGGGEPPVSSLGPAAPRGELERSGDGATRVSRSRGTDPIACPTPRSYCMNACKVKCGLPGRMTSLGPVDWR